MYPGVGTFVLIRPTQTFYERIIPCSSPNRSFYDAFAQRSTRPTVVKLVAKGGEGGNGFVSFRRGLKIGACLTMWTRVARRHLKPPAQCSVSTGLPASIQPLVPPARLVTRVWPTAFRKPAERKERFPVAHTTSTSRSFGTSAKRRARSA